MSHLAGLVAGALMLACVGKWPLHLVNSMVRDSCCADEAAGRSRTRHCFGGSRQHG